MRVIGFDTETTSPHRAGKFLTHEADILGYSLSVKDGDAVYVEGRPPAALFDTPDVTWVAHHALFDYVQVMNTGVQPPPLEDTRLMAYLLGYVSTTLKNLTHQLLGIKPITYKDVTKGRDMAEIPVEDVVAYAAADADHTRLLYHVLLPQLRRWGLEELYRDVELPLIPILAQAESRGILLDRGRAEWARNYFYRRQHHHRIQSHRTSRTGRRLTVNIASTDQLGAWLKDNHAPIYEFTEVKGLPKTDRATLSNILSWDEDIVGAILGYKEMAKLADFPSKWLALAHPDTDVINCDINQAGHTDELVDNAGEAPATGRLSGSSPNLMQIPKHGTGTTRGHDYLRYGRLLRSCFQARDGYVFMAADIGQQEPRVATVVTGEPEFWDAFNRGEAIYGPFGQELYQYPINKNDNPGEWDVAKKSILSFIWRGLNPRPWITRLHTELDPTLTQTQAEFAYDRLLHRFEGVAQFRQEVLAKLQRDGHVRDYFGRIRWFPGIFSPRETDRGEALRAAINFLIQGPAATILKIAIRRLYDRVQAAGLDAHFILPIHDEIVYEVALSDLDALVAMVYNIVDDCMGIHFPFEPNIGSNLGNLRPI